MMRSAASERLHAQATLALAARVTRTSPQAAGSTGESRANTSSWRGVIGRRRSRKLIGQEHVTRGVAKRNLDRPHRARVSVHRRRGTGKTSTARILAKALNCVTGPTPRALQPVRHLQEHQHAATTSMRWRSTAPATAASTKFGNLRQNVNIRPSRSRFKIYIIDEVHMLTNEAFNALLKTLEEPPEHVKFIFCTTEAEKIPITILSRCQRFDFAGVQMSAIVERLAQICQAEGIEAEAEALNLLARRAAGSMRDSQSLLEQLLAFGEAEDHGRRCPRMLGTAGSVRMAAIVRHLAERNSTAALADLDAAIAEGVDVGQLLDQLLGYFRDLMVAVAGLPGGRAALQLSGRTCRSWSRPGSSSGWKRSWR